MTKVSIFPLQNKKMNNKPNKIDVQYFEYIESGQRQKKKKKPVNK
jgi:hypothetical protein